MDANKLFKVILWVVAAFLAIAAFEVLMKVSGVKYNFKTNSYE
ncbi:hypothetical protein [Mucilaginibacter pankratovii]|nr:hypothetical protein [Mucilaginibacter pankratovii]